jgi:lipopolysaccharide export system permease protein
LIIQRYLYREVGLTFAGVFGVLTLVWVSHRFVRYLAKAAAGSLSGDLILELLGLKFAANLAPLMAPALYLSVLLAVGRLYRDSEMTALAAAGVGPGRLLRATLSLSLVFALGAGVVSFYLSPLAALASDEVENRAEDQADFSNILAGRFRDLSGGDRVFYAEGVKEDGRTLTGAFAQVRTRDRLHILAAEEAYLQRDPQSGDRFMVLVDGHRYEGEPGSVDFVVTRYREHAVRVEEGREESPARRIWGLPTTELLGSTAPARRAELHWRLSVPVSCIVLGGLGFLLARTSPREGRYGGLFVAVGVYFVYSALLGAGRELIERGHAPPALGLWPVHAAFVLTGLGIAFAQSARGRRLAVRLGRRLVGASA